MGARPTTETPVLSWLMTEGIRDDALQGMDHFGRTAGDGAEQGADLRELLGGPVDRFELHRDLIVGAARFARAIGHPLRGVAADLGSGRGVGACVLSTLPEIDRVYAIEYSAQFVRQVMPAVFARYGADTAKIQRVIGDFNKLDLPAASLDTILGLASYHHAEDLDRALAESARVLRPGGVLLAVERAHADHVTDRELQTMLDKDYGEAWKRKRGKPVDQPFTRRDWGEHEYRIREWLAAFARAGFDAAILWPWNRRGLEPLLRRLSPFGPTLTLAAAGYRAGRRRLRYCYPGSKRALFVCVRRGATRG